jgi:hypothetical protein
MKHNQRGGRQTAVFLVRLRIGVGRPSVSGSHVLGDNVGGEVRDTDGMRSGGEGRYDPPIQGRLRRPGGWVAGQGTVWAVILGTVILSTGHTTDREEGCPTGWSNATHGHEPVPELRYSSRIRGGTGGWGVGRLRRGEKHKKEKPCCRLHCTHQEIGPEGKSRTIIWIRTVDTLHFGHKLNYDRFNVGYSVQTEKGILPLN